MEGAYKDKYTFIGEWYDNFASLYRRYNINYYPLDDAISMFDLKNQKTFLKRYKVDGLRLEDLYIGGTVYILGRMVKIIDFACEDSRRKLEDDMQLAFVLIKPIDTQTAGKILTYLHAGGLRLTRMKRSVITADDIAYICRRILRTPEYPFLMSYMCDQQVYGLQLICKSAVARCLELFGDQDPKKAAPGTIRALYGLDAVRNCAHVSFTQEDALEDLKYFFPTNPRYTDRFPLTPTLSNCTLCVIKPTAVKEGKLGKAFELIDQGGFDITALNMYSLCKTNAAAFLAIYKGIAPEYQSMVDEMTSGPCVAMEIVSKDKRIHSAVAFRKFVGPCDPNVARLIQPNSMRAQLGTTKLQNAVHCSDLPDDGLLEVEYFFKILYL